MTQRVTDEGDLLWSPSQSVIDAANLTRYMGWLREQRGLDFANYQALWQWSVSEVEAFWASVWDYFGVVSSKPYTTVLLKRTMPGARWLVGAELNFAENVFRRSTSERPALLYRSESEPLSSVSWQELSTRTAKLAHTLRLLGVGKGDRVAGYLPNLPEAFVAVL